MTDEHPKATLEQTDSRSIDPDKLTTRAVEHGDQQVIDRQERIEGFDQSILEGITVLLVGAGAIGGEIAEGLVKKGVGSLNICDEDVVDVTNLNRQKFTADDIGDNKATSLAANLVPHGTTGTEITAHPLHFEDAVALGVKFDPDLVICAPDNDAARKAVSEHFRDEVPVIITGLDTEANSGYVFVQNTAAPCFDCFRPDAGLGGTCPAAPAVVDPTKVVAGITLFAGDTALMERHRTWDFFEFFLAGELPTRAVTIDPPDFCPECS